MRWTLTLELIKAHVTIPMSTTATTQPQTTPIMRDVFSSSLGERAGPLDVCIGITELTTIHKENQSFFYKKSMK